MIEYLRLLLRNKTVLRIVVPIGLVLLLGVWTKTEYSLSIIRALPLTVWTLTLAVTVSTILLYIVLEYATTKSWIRLTLYGICWDNSKDKTFHFDRRGCFFTVHSRERLVDADFDRIAERHFLSFKQPDGPYKDLPPAAELDLRGV